LLLWQPLVEIGARSKVNVIKYGTNRPYSLFLNVPIPGLGGSFGLDRQGQSVPV
jgi:hypothetical protein